MKILLKFAPAGGGAGLDIAQGAQAHRCGCRAGQRRQPRCLRRRAIQPPIASAARGTQLAARARPGIRDAHQSTAIQSDDIPVIVDIDVAWFGKRWFFDNGDLGLRAASTTSGSPPTWWRASTAIARSSARRTRSTSIFRSWPRRAATARDRRTVPDGRARSAPGNPQPLKVPNRDLCGRSSDSRCCSAANGARRRCAASTTSVARTTAYELVRRLQLPLHARPPVVFTHRWASPTRATTLSDYYWGVHSDEAGFTLARVPRRRRHRLGSRIARQLLPHQEHCAWRCRPTTSACTTASRRARWWKQDYVLRLLRRSRAGSSDAC